MTVDDRELMERKGTHVSYPSLIPNFRARVVNARTSKKKISEEKAKQA